MIHIVRRSIERFGLSHGIAVFGAVFMLAAAAALAIHVADLRRKLLDDRIDDARMHAQAIESRATRSLDAAAMTLRRIHDLIELDPAARVRGGAEFRSTLAGVLRHLPFAATVLVVDDAGDVVHAAPDAASPGFDAAALPNFRAHAGGERGVLVGAPFRLGQGEPWVVPVSIGRLESDGSFMGAVVIGIPLDHFLAAFESVRRAGLDTAALHLTDGGLVARVPFEPERLGRPFPNVAALGADTPGRREGAAIRPAPVDGVERLLAWRALPDWPLTVTVGMDAGRLRDEAQAITWRYVGATLAICAVIAALILLLIRQLERRQSAEQRMRSAVDNMTEAFALYGPDDRLVLCTAAYARLYDPDSRPEALIGVEFAEMVRRSLAHGEKPALGYTEAQWIAERVRRHRDPPGKPHVQQLGGGRWVQVSERKLPDGSIVGLRTDITTIKRREKQLEDARRDAELANRAKSRFLAAMSHELRTPLNAILGFSEIIRDLRFGRAPLERYAAYAADIHRSGEHLLDLINDLLDMSKIEAGRYSLNEQALDVAGVIEHCLGMLRERARAAGVALAAVPAGAMPLLHADERALRQVLLNVLSNAVKFTPEGGRADVAVALEGDGRLAIVVRDTGVGIPAKVRPRLFQPFAQADSALVRDREGTGLGLSISRALVELHGGTITLDSEEGRGTTVTVRFPRERVLAPPVRRLAAAG